MNSKTKQVISYNTNDTRTTKYGIGVFNIRFTNDVNKAMNYSHLWGFKYIALRNFKNKYPEELHGFIGFQNLLLLSGKMDGMFGGLVKKD
jgi:hypothetical protein